MERCPNCGSYDVLIVGGRYPGAIPLMSCRECNWKNYPARLNTEMPTDKIHEFMEAVIEISKSLKNQENNKDKTGVAKIKPCPFCGSENVCVARPQEWEVGEVCYMHCNSCCTSTQLEPDEETAIKHWNRRSEG